MCYGDQVPAPYRLDDLRIVQRGEWHPERFRRWPCGLAARRLYPVPIVGQQGGRILLQAIGQKQRHTAWRQDLDDLMDDPLRHRQGALADLEGQQQLGDRIDRRPHPVRGTREARDGLTLADLARLHGTEQGKELIEWLPCKFPPCGPHLHASWCPQGGMTALSQITENRKVETRK